MSEKKPQRHQTDVAAVFLVGLLLTDLHTAVVFPLFTLNKEMVSVKQIFKVMIKARQLRKMFKNKKVPPITC